MYDNWKIFTMKNEAVVESEQSVNRFYAILKVLSKKPDADEYFDEHIRKTLDPELPATDISFYQRLSTYLFQFYHYTGLIKRDIESFRNNQIIYLIVYLSGMVIVPAWLIFLEYSQITVVNDALISWSLIGLYAAILLCGLWFSVHTVLKIKLINDSKENLFLKVIDVISACREYNLDLFNDCKNGTSPGFDDKINSNLGIENLLDYEFPTIQQSYSKYLLNNEHFDYPHLAGIIRTHHALHTNRIKDGARKDQQIRDDYMKFADQDEKALVVDINIEEQILNRHITEIEKLHNFYNDQIKKKFKKNQAK